MSTGKKKSLVVHFVLLALVGAGVVGVRAYLDLSNRGTVRITTRPAGATIVFDSMLTTSEFADEDASWSRPLVLRRKPGTYSFGVALSGYAPRTGKVVVLSGRTVSLDLDLEPVDDDSRADVASGVSGPTPTHIVEGHTFLHAAEAVEAGGRGRPRPSAATPVRPVEAIRPAEIPTVRPAARPLAPVRPLVPVRPIPVRPFIPVRPIIPIL